MRFRDVYLPECLLSYDVVASPRFATEIVSVDSGAESANQKWSQALHQFSIPEAVRSMDIYKEVLDHWMVMAGPAYTFPFRNPMDFTSTSISGPGIADAITPNDQTIGTGTGARLTFQITKTYQRGAYQHARKIYLPVVSSVRVALNGVEQIGNFSVGRETGIITFNSAPALNAQVTCGFYYDVCVRFEADDSFDAIAKSYSLAGVADLTLVETILC